MAQRQFITYQSELLSFEAMEAFLGILKPGRYSGYSTITSNGTPSAGNIPLLISHQGGIEKLAKGASSLSASVGVMVTTSGSIIHEDQSIPITITDNSGGANPKYSLVYMEHLYQDGIQGDNPAIYGVINGTSGGGIPVLTSDYKRSLVGVIEQAPGSINVSGCTWMPRPAELSFGDTAIFAKLFGADSDAIKSKTGSEPVDGIIGDRVFTEENYAKNTLSLTKSLDALDMVLKDVGDAIIAVGGRALDDIGWGNLSDITRFNVSTSNHGFMPKLPNDSTKVFNGVGSWVNFTQKIWKFRTNPGVDFQKVDFGNFVSSSGTLDLSAKVLSDVDVIYALITVTSSGPAPALGISIAFRPFGSIGVYQNTGDASLVYGATNNLNIISAHMMLPIDPTTKKLDWLFVGLGSDVSAVTFTIFAQQTAL